MHRKLFWLCLCFLLMPKASWATAQVADKLVYMGQTHRLYSLPLEDCFKGQKVRPYLGMVSTACYRGYVAKGFEPARKLIEKHCFAKDAKRPSSIAVKVLLGPKGQVAKVTTKTALLGDQGDCVSRAVGLAAEFPPVDGTQSVTHKITFGLVQRPHPRSKKE